MTEVRIVVSSGECGDTDWKGQEGTLEGYIDVLYLGLGC